MSFRRISFSDECNRLSFSDDTVVWVLVAIVVSTPLIYLIMNSWLASFAYHIKVDFWIIVFSGFGVVFVSVITVFYESFRAANSKPIDSLRYE